MPLTFLLAEGAQEYDRLKIDKTLYSCKVNTHLEDSRTPPYSTRHRGPYRIDAQRLSNGFNEWATTLMRLKSCRAFESIYDLRSLLPPSYGVHVRNQQEIKLWLIGIDGRTLEDGLRIPQWLEIFTFSNSAHRTSGDSYEDHVWLMCVLKSEDRRICLAIYWTEGSAEFCKMKDKVSFREDEG